jgi:hypothetical protein
MTMRTGCCSNCWGRKFDVDICEVDYNEYERKSVRMLKGDCCWVCNNFFFTPKISAKIHLKKKVIK